jgi:hypothetical protein
MPDAGNGVDAAVGGAVGGDVAVASGDGQGVGRGPGSRFCSDVIRKPASKPKTTTTINVIRTIMRRCREVKPEALTSASFSVDTLGT